MDKNFINIDDLVRQRLGGGEEQERPGAWLRMNELLDKEMPKDKFFGMYWRRMLSAVAVLLLIATISIGGYELSANRNLKGNDKTVAIAAPAATSSSSSSSNTLKNNDINDDNVNNEGNKQVSSAGNTENNEPKDGAANNKQHSKKSAANNSHKNGDINKQLVASTDKTLTNTPTDKEAFSASSDDENEMPAANNKVANKAGVNKKETAKEVAVSKKENDKTGAKEVAPTKYDKAPVAKDIAAGTSATSVATTPGKTKEAKAGNNETATNNKKSGTRTNGARAKADKTKDESMSTLALNGKATITAAGNPTETSETNIAATPAKTAKKTGMAKLALNSGMPAAKRTEPKRVASVKADKTINTKGSPKKDNTVASGKAVVVSASTTSGNITTGISNVAKPNVLPVAAKSAADMKREKEIAAINLRKGKKVVQKLVLLERYIKITPTEGYYHIDTISMEEVTEELGVANENKPYFPKSARNAKAAKTAGVASASETNDNTVAADPQLLPGASASTSGKPAMGARENATGKKSAGASALENLSAKFNDIKYNIAGVKFAAGLTGGINGTFFGPSSFNGFQFGLTGDFIFSNTWSIASAIEYFHRINGNYSLYDNYYSYTPTTGGFSKVEQSYEYNFSTLHSVEMPIAVKYSIGNFNFIVGGNLVYTFSINTGRAPNTSPVPPPTVVSAQGNDNVAKLTESDFNARFGLGCLFGVSYQVAPNVTLDLRNVQTLWDNAKSPGAKYVSDQLYKSPSIQLSVGYRLGSNKNKDK